MKNEIYIPILLGTGREGRFSEKVALYVLEKIKEFKLQTEILDVKDFVTASTIAPWMENNEPTKKWRNIVTRANGLIMVVPEYNRGYPGELKIVLDQASKEYLGKPVFVCGVSSGNFGGVRMFQHLLPVLHYLGLNVVGEGIFFSNVKDEFTNPDYSKLDEKYKKQVELSLNNLLSIIKIK